MSKKTRAIADRYQADGTMDAAQQSINDRRLEIMNQIHIGLENVRRERDEQIERVNVQTAATITSVQRQMNACTASAVEGIRHCSRDLHVFGDHHDIHRK
jgi:hypothetical protein